MTLLLELMFRLCVRHSPPGCQSPLRGRLRLNCEITQISQSTCGHAPPLELPLPTLSASGGGDRYPSPKPTSAITAPRKPTSPNRRPPKPTSPNRLPQTDGRDHRTAQTAGRDHRTAQTDGRDHRTAQTDGRDHRTAQTDGRDHRTVQTDGRDHRTVQTDGRDHRTAGTDVRPNLSVARGCLNNCRALHHRTITQGRQRRAQLDGRALARILTRPEDGFASDRRSACKRESKKMGQWRHVYFRTLQRQPAYSRYGFACLAVTPNLDRSCVGCCTANIAILSEPLKSTSLRHWRDEVNARASQKRKHRY